MGAVGWGLGLVVGVLLVAVLPTSIGLGTNLSPSGPGKVVAALRMRAQLSDMTLDMGLPEYQQLISDDFRTAHPSDRSSLCVSVTARVGAVTDAATLCPALGSRGLIESARPSFELHPGTDATLFDGDPLLFMPATSDAALVTGYMQALKDQGLPTPHFEILHVALNGSNWGLYTAESLWVDEPPESLVAESGQYGLAFSLPDSSQVPGTVGIGSDFARAEVRSGYLPGMVGGAWTVGDAGDADSVRAMRRARQRWDESMREWRPPSDVIDVRTMGDYMALTALWRGVLVPDWRATRFIYDGDAMHFVPLGSGLAHTAEMGLPAQLYNDPAVQRSYARALRKYGAATYLDGLRLSDLETLHFALGNDQAEDGLVSYLRDNQARMRAAIASPQTVRVLRSFNGDYLMLDIEALSPFPVEVLGLGFGEEGYLPLVRDWLLTDDGVIAANQDQVVLRARLGDRPESVVVRVPRVEVPYVGPSEGTDLHLVTRVWGLDTHFMVPIRLRPSGPGDGDT